jgi:hypothetical protein
MSTGLSHHVEELAHRETDGVEVALLWRPSDGSLTVVCADARTGDQFAVAAEPANALEVFYHPYAYAARQRVSYSVPSRVCAEAVAA